MSFGVLTRNLAWCSGAYKESSKYYGRRKYQTQILQKLNNNDQFFLCFRCFGKTVFKKFSLEHFWLISHSGMRSWAIIITQHPLREKVRPLKHLSEFSPSMGNYEKQVRKKWFRRVAYFPDYSIKVSTVSSAVHGFVAWSFARQYSDSNNWSSVNK